MNYLIIMFLLISCTTPAQVNKNNRSGNTWSISNDAVSFAEIAQIDTTLKPYFVLTASFVTKYNVGKLKVGVNQFHAVKTKDGRWVCSANSINEFEAKLAELSITKANIQGKIIWLRKSDFPTFKALP